MVKAFHLPGFIIEEENESEYEDQDDEDGLDPELEIEDNDFGSLIDKSIPAEHHGCFAHKLQLVIHDGFKKAAQIKRIIRKCSKIVSHTRKSTIAAETLEYNKTLQPANATRWNSQLKMLQSILSIPTDKLEALDDVPKLSAYECNLIKELIDILIPFNDATEFAQVESYPSAGYVLPCIRGLEHHLNTITTKYHSMFVHELKQSLSKRMTVYETKNDYVLAAVLDPRFKMLWCRDSNDKKLVKDIVKNELAQIASSLDDGELSCYNENDDCTPSPTSKKRKTIFSFMNIDCDMETDEGDISNYEIELKKYLEEPCEDEQKCPLMYWKRQQRIYPILTQASLNVLGIPASSAPVERLFSVAGKVFRLERCRLTDETFQKLMFIRCNAKFSK
jgi:hypothetical protein